MYRTVRQWARRHPRVVDAALVAPLLVLSVLRYVLGGGGPGALALVAEAALCASFIVRRDRPVVSFATAAAVAFVQWWWDLGLLPADLVLFAGLYTVASRCRWELAAASAGVLGLGAVLASAQWAPATDVWTQHWPATVMVASMWIWGHAVRTRREYVASLQERAAAAERERDQQAQIAAAAERARIARELHDVVAHGLSVMVVQADGAAYAIESDPGQARRALGTISSTGREAQAEMRRMLGLLRAEGSGPYAPQPDLGQLEPLVEQVRRAGVPVQYTIEGVPRALPAGVELVVYRVVQEALTNTLKHAGPTVRGARVQLGYGDEALEVRVCDDGRGAAARVADSAVSEAHNGSGRSGQGYGLVGMAERVAACAGSLRAGPTSGGGYEVVAVLPLPRTHVEVEP